MYVIFFFKQKTAYEMRLMDVSSDLCASDLLIVQRAMPATNAREYRELHNHLFQDVYDWAGRLRTVDISKPGSTFARAHFIARSMEHEFKQLPDLQTLKSMDRDRFADTMGRHISELNAVDRQSTRLNS